jgi:hypothetical protein
MKLKLLRAPELRVFGATGERVTAFALEPEGADLRERKLRARGHLALDLAELPRDLLAAWDDLQGGTPVALYVVPDEGLGRAVLRADRPAAVGIDRTQAVVPQLAPRLRALPRDWASAYLRQWERLEPYATLGNGEELRIYAEGTVVVTCLATDCRPLREEIRVAPGQAVERTLVLEPEAWAPQEIVVTDRFGREGPVSVAIVEPAYVPLASPARVPRGGGPYTLRADGGPRGSATRTVETLPSKEPIRFDLTGMEVHLRLVDEESGDPIEGLALRVDGRPVEWRPEEGLYVFGPVDPGTVRLVHDDERAIDLRVDPAEAEKGILTKEARVRGFPKGGGS